MLLPKDFDINGMFPRLSRKLRLGVIGGGRVSEMQATAARLSGYWDIVAGAFSSNEERAKEASTKWFLPEKRCYLSFEEMAEME